VFGASGGIGSALCRRLAGHDGAQVVLIGRNTDKLGQLQQELSANTSVLVADVLDTKQVRASLAEAGVMTTIRHPPHQQRWSAS
jgi:NADP-dependent 3-hydroxy acid dehydrogenase YdfG